MHDVKRHVLSHIFHNIPKSILETAFVPKGGGPKNSLDFYIWKTVIEKRVLPDCNLFAGKKKHILLTQDMLEKVNLPRDYTMMNSSDIGVFRIPPEKREYRDISHVIEVRYPYSASGYNSVNFPTNSNHGHTVLSKANQVLNSHTHAHNEAPPRPVLLSNNLVKLDPPQFNHLDYLLVCMLKYDNNFTNLNPDSIMPLKELALSATKAYIYNELVLKIAHVSMLHGQEFGSFREKVEQYESENERYEELLREFRGGATLDDEVITDLISGIF